MNWIAYLVAALGALLMVVLHRASAISSVRIAMICDDFYWPLGYARLPSYNAMLFNFRYWLLWTPDQWKQRELFIGLLAGDYKPLEKAHA